jgi:hypothetical protein
MPKLNEDAKRLIVMELAMFRTPSEVAATLKEEYGLVVERGHIHAYNPEGVHGPKLAQKWLALHAATRERFLKEIGAIPIAQQSFRLRKLNDMLISAKARGNVVLAAQLLEQAAKEVGGTFTNRRQLSGPEGGPIEFDDVSGMTPGDRKARIAQLLGIAAAEGN